VPEVPHDATVALRLELGRMTDKANALEAAFRKEVMDVVGRSVAQATYDAKEDLAAAHAQIAALEKQVAELYANVDKRDLYELSLFWRRMQKASVMGWKEPGVGAATFRNMVSDLVSQRWSKKKKLSLYSKQVLEKLDAYEVSGLDDNQEDQTK
jgi:hypothetical protein